MEKSTQILTIMIYQEEGSQCICLSLTLVDSVYRKDKDYYPQVFLEKCNYVVKDDV